MKQLSYTTRSEPGVIAATYDLSPAFRAFLKLTNKLLIINALTGACHPLFCHPLFS
jgi:hypothetical protein